MDKFSGHTADSFPATPTTEALLPTCTEHPDGGSRPGYGYAGGGFGPYRICSVCDTVFGKREEK